MMDERKRIAIAIAGIKPQFPMSPSEPSSEQKFDQMWPCKQSEYLRRADELLKEPTP